MKLFQYFEIVGKPISDTFETLGRFYIFLYDSIRWFFKPPYRFKLFWEQIEKIGVNSFPVIALSSLAIGMIFALQITYIMRLFRSEIMVGATVAITLGRELAPVITAMMLIAKNGSAMAAEIGTMRVTEQIDALETMAVNPIHYLVVPKIFASVITFPILTSIANIIGITGSYLVAVKLLKVDESGFFEIMYWYTDPADIYSGIIKSVFLGFIVAVICCYNGFNTKNGAKGVGKATTTAVVTSSVAILIADYILADIMLKTILR